MPFPERSPRNLPPVFLVLTLSCVYLYTLAPGLAWANNGSDGGDLVTAAYTGGIAHPTGYPLYLLLARLFQFLPVGSLAYRTNLMSVVATVFSAVLIYKIVAYTLRESGFDRTWLSGLTAGFAFGLAPLVWSQAVITEVYALQAFLTVLILYLFVIPFPQVEPKALERIRGLVTGLAMGNHVTTIFMFPLIFFSGSKANSKSTRLKSASSLIRQLVWFSIGLSVYLTLPLRALTNPPVNWGNPVTLKRFWWLISGELYRSYYLRLEFSEIPGRVQAWASLLIQQFGWLALVLGIIGLILFFSPSRLYSALIWASLAYSLFAFIYSSDDSYVYLIPLYISFAVWIGLGMGNVLNRVPLRPDIAMWGAVLLLAGHFAFRVSGYVAQVDASKDLQAEVFGRRVMTEVPKDALVFTKGDRALFSLWYFHFALHQRPDMVIIAEELLHFDWYQETLQSTYPSLVIPGPFPWSQNIADANQMRPVCYVQSIDQPQVECE